MYASGSRIRRKSSNVRYKSAASFGAVVVAVTAVTAVLLGQQAPPGQSEPLVFRSGVNLVLVDVVARDKKGAVVKGLSKDDFELFEDGKKQDILSFSFEEISAKAEPIASAAMLSAVTATAATPTATAPAAPPKPVTEAPKPLTSDEAAGHRLLTLLFDTSSMAPEDVTKAVDSAQKWVDENMTPADLVAVATIGSSLQILTDFTSSKDDVTSVLRAFSAADGMAFTDVDASTASTDDTNNTAADNTQTVDASAQELDTFNNDVRLRALKTLAEALAPIQQKKAILYFSSGMQRNGTDNQVELRAAVNAAVRANVAIYPVDSRGLQAVVPGGDARTASRGGTSAFSGSAVAQQFTTLQAQQETLTTLAADTGGTAFTDSNDFGEAFAKVTKTFRRTTSSGLRARIRRKTGDSVASPFV